MKNIVIVSSTPRKNGNSELLAAEFKKENPSIVCRELLGLSKADANPTPEARTEQYYKKRPCVQLVADAAAAAEKILFANEQEETK